MKYGQLALAAIGVAMLVTGVIVALVSSLVAGVAIMVVGLFPLAMGLSNWHELEAQVTRVAVKLRLAKAPPPASSEAPRPDVRILGMRSTGGDSDAVDFAIDVVNYGTRQCRCTIRADVDGNAVYVHPSPLDLIPNQLPVGLRVRVPRPDLGDLVPEFDSETTLYNRALTAVVSDGERDTSDEWRELVYDENESAARFAIQQRVWRIGRGEGTDADFRAEKVSELLRHHEERVERES